MTEADKVALTLMGKLNCGFCSYWVDHETMIAMDGKDIFTGHCTTHGVKSHQLCHCRRFAPSQHKFNLHAGEKHD